MTINLPPDLTRRLEAEVAAGRGQSISEVVQRALRAHFLSRDDLLRQLDLATADYDANGGHTWDEVSAWMDERIADKG